MKKTSLKGGAADLEERDFVICEESDAMKKSWFNLKIPLRGVLALFGGFLIQLTLGSFYSFGNMSTYMTSYMRAHGAPELSSGDFIVVQSAWGMTQGVVMPISGFIIRIIGPRVAMFSGCFIFSLGTALTYFTINSGNVWLVAFTYGVVSAFGQGIALIPTMTIGMRWFPKRKGMAMGFVVGGFGGGTFFWSLIQTAIVNPDNLAVTEGLYFTDEVLLSRVPPLLLKMSAIYFCVQMVACLMVTEPGSFSKKKNSGDESKGQEQAEYPDDEDDDSTVTPWEALKTKEFYILWFTRFCVVLLTQAIAAENKWFGQSFIRDDHFLSMVVSVSSLFNCAGRLFYGMTMDKTTYRTAMTLETVLLASLISTLTFTSSLGKAAFAVWIWAIYFTFPGTYSTQPAVTTQTFGHRNGGTIYGLLFTADVVNNLLVGVMSGWIKDQWGWTGFFLVLAVFPTMAAFATCLFPWYPSPQTVKKAKKNLSKDINAKEDDKDEGSEKGGEDKPSLGNQVKA